MRSHTLFPGLLVACCLLVLRVGTASPQEKAAAGAVQVHVVITAEAGRDDSETPVLRQGDVRVMWETISATFENLLARNPRRH
jgi:hypothetical protein